MKFNLFFILLSAVIILSACESTVTDSTSSNQYNATLEYSGGLNVSFAKDISEFSKSIKIVNQENDSYLLDLQLNVKTFNDSQREQASLQLDIPFVSQNGIFPTGQYILTNEEISSAYGNYELIKNNGDFARYNFEGVSATLVIEESNAEHVNGSFILNMEQLNGKRMLDGQLEDVVLNSPIRLLSQFNLEF
ncbi:MAG: hypothetical protein OEM46_02610 [Ignavibacteria bacterium]|nr:hypothetical protein [Ignavibacteria bacterium]